MKLNLSLCAAFVLVGALAGSLSTSSAAPPQTPAVHASVPAWAASYRTVLHPYRP